ncbi:class I SAM-dependent methyltransferase [Erythrobacter sp. JK5]|uniref:class I SAM-dependent methyltransferase n=1 Tax=Erythrobacter sp. JK5 TaxID=2829500 RepID=UPI001BA49C86|nr:class I SAM-dependent methyltransferase [Erythrobacter sp. JK5]QUL38945.1 class I SAM-dependent methyltransferase [Erythrobacter sp. JK5]
MPTPEISSNEAAWDLASQKYAVEDEFARDVELLMNGGTTLMPVEIEELGDLSGVDCAVHLCCSHGSDVLSLLNHGVTKVVGIDISNEMLALARRKTAALEANASWIHAEVLEPQPSLTGNADLVYTGRGGLPWVRNLNVWAARVADLLRTGGRLYVFEGHPLNWVWARDTQQWQVTGDYFERTARANQDFPAMAVEQFAEHGAERPKAYEWQWTLGDVVSAVAGAGLRIEFLHEHAFNFWPLFDELDKEQGGKVPQSFSLMAIKAQ